MTFESLVKINNKYTSCIKENGDDYKDRKWWKVDMCESCFAAELSLTALGST